MSQSTSVTFWHRLCPRPHSTSIKQSLKACIRDPLWMMSRQWQWGEFQAEDAGSPVFAELSTTCSPIGDDKEPLEKKITKESPDVNFSLRVELGQILAYLLSSNGAGNAISEFHSRFPIVQPKKEELKKDQELARFLEICADRCMDGVAVYFKLENLISTETRQTVKNALEKFAKWVKDVWGEIQEDQVDPLSWNSKRLEYVSHVSAPKDDASEYLLSANLNLNGTFDWYGFDFCCNRPKMISGKLAESKVLKILLPRNHFPGMTSPRWWEFEPNIINIADIKPDKTDIAKLIFIDFMLVNSNDWFIIPFEMPVGSLCKINSLKIHDVFGNITNVENSNCKEWTMFSPSKENNPSEPTDIFILPPSIAGVVHSGKVLEEINMVRDEIANVVWAIEKVLQDGIGQPRDQHEPACTQPDLSQSFEENEQDVSNRLVYKIQSEIAPYWIPFLPLLKGNEVLLVRPEQAIPSSKSLKSAVELLEEEIQRPGMKILRTPQRTRWIDGSTHIWTVRKKIGGSGEENSGLRFDLAESKP